MKKEEKREYTHSDFLFITKVRQQKGGVGKSDHNIFTHSDLNLVYKPRSRSTNLDLVLTFFNSQTKTYLDLNMQPSKYEK